jgi:hypothetical protein
MKRALYLRGCSRGFVEHAAFPFVVRFFTVPTKDKLQKNTVYQEHSVAFGLVTFSLF